MQQQRHRAAQNKEINTRNKQVNKNKPAVCNLHKSSIFLPKWRSTLASSQSPLGHITSSFPFHAGFLNNGWQLFQISLSFKKYIVCVLFRHLIHKHLKKNKKISSLPFISWSRAPRSLTEHLSSVQHGGKRWDSHILALSLLGVDFRQVHFPP